MPTRYAHVIKTKDAERIAAQVTESTGRQLRSLMRELVFYALIAMIVVLGLPFVARLLPRQDARTALTAHTRGDFGNEPDGAVTGGVEQTASDHR